MRVALASVASLRFTDGSPVRAASAIAALGDGWLIAQDDGTHGGWLRDSTLTPLRLLPPVEGLDHFTEAGGTKHLKPDLEAACEVAGGVLLLGSGSTPARMRSVLVRLGSGGPEVTVLDLSAGYAAVAAALGVAAGLLNLEGACVLGERLRWFQRGLPAAGVPTAAVDVALEDLLEGRVRVLDVHAYHLGENLAVTDAVALGDGRVIVSAVAENSPNAYDDGPVVASALALLDGPSVVDVAQLPAVDGRVAKVEGLTLVAADAGGVTLLATVDADDPQVASPLVGLDVSGIGRH